MWSSGLVVPSNLLMGFACMMVSLNGEEPSSLIFSPVFCWRSLANCSHWDPWDELFPYSEEASSSRASRACFFSRSGFILAGFDLIYGLALKVSIGFQTSFTVLVSKSVVIIHPLPNHRSRWTVDGWGEAGLRTTRWAIVFLSPPFVGLFG